MPLVRIEKLSPYALPPTKGSGGAACYDLYAAEDVTIHPGKTQAVPLGFRVAVQKGYVLEIVPRSGLALHNSITVVNSPGQVDDDFRGEVKVILHNMDPRWVHHISIGDRIAQCRILPVVPILWEEDSIDPDETERGEGGYGSSGK